mgnify:CR=1 FL=1
MTKLFPNCHCVSKKEHLRELERDYNFIFDHVCSGKLNPKDEKQQLELAIKLDQEYRHLRDTKESKK